MKASNLKVQIQREEKIVVDLKFPIFVLNSLEIFIPEKAFEYLKQSNIDLKVILKNVEDSNYSPQTILEFDHDERHFKIWIE
jgi:hypothetical protein